MSRFISMNMASLIEMNLDLYWKSSICLAALFLVAWNVACFKASLTRAKLKDQRWIQRWKIQRHERNRLLQREIYFREELGQVEKQDDEKSSDRWDTLQQSLEHTIQELWLCKRAMRALLLEKADSGPLVHKYWVE
jgi:hypothetical protein